MARQIGIQPGVPPQEVIDALDAGVVRVIRRVEVCESNGTTLWNPSPVEDPDFKRLIDGSVSVDYSSAERRKLDITLDNSDQKLRINPEGGFWYDKIIKVFRGIEFSGQSIAPQAAIIEAPSELKGRELRTTLSGLGFNKTVYLPDTPGEGELNRYSYILSDSGSGSTARAALLESLWRSGKNVVTIGTGNGIDELPFVSSIGASTSNTLWGISPATGDYPAKGSFTTEQYGNAAPGRRPTGLSGGAIALSLWVDDNALSTITGSLAVSPRGSYWLDLHLPALGPQAKNLLRSVLNFMRGYESDLWWETQLGEFMIDNVNADHFPDMVKVTGRDYAKKMLNSKLSSTTTFKAGTKLFDLLRALAVNSGINPLKLKIAVSGELLASEMSYERGTDRWAIAKAACDSFNYEIFFDAYGYLVVRKFIDPTLGPISWTFKTGYEEDSEGANLVSFSRTTHDSRIYNHVVVTSDPTDGEERLPYFGQARNEDPSSPTRIARLGERTLPLDAPWLSSDADCAKLAKDRLKIVALESYEMSLSSIYYPWLEVGEISQVLDPDRLDFEPTRYLVDSLSYPLGLGPMSGTAKRVTFVGSSGSPDEVLEGTD